MGNSSSSSKRSGKSGGPGGPAMGLGDGPTMPSSKGDGVEYAIKEFKDPKSAMTRDSSKPVRLLVVHSNSDQNFYELFKGRTLANGRPIVVEQAGWQEIMMSVYTDAKAVCTLSKPRKPLEGTPQAARDKRTFQPDFLLIRNVVNSVIEGRSRMNALYGFMVANLPSINNLYSIYCMAERPLMVAELVRMNREFGQDQFPIFSTTYYSDFQEMIITPAYPCVVKIGAGHAGLGKMKLDNHHQFTDLKSVVACTPHYCTAEDYIEGSHDLRIQKIGPNYRVFKRTSMSGNWKTNTGTAMIEDLPLLPRYKFWADECAKCFGGMDIVTVDALVSAKDGSERILEFNGTASGFGYKDEDNVDLIEYTIDRMNRHFCAYLFEDETKEEEEKKEDDGGPSAAVDTGSDVVPTAAEEVAPAEPDADTVAVSSVDPIPAEEEAAPIVEQSEADYQAEPAQEEAPEQAPPEEAGVEEAVVSVETEEAPAEEQSS